MRWRILLVAALVFVMAAEQKTDKGKQTKPKKDDPAAGKADLAKLQGKWQFTKLINDGIEVAEAGLTSMEIIIKGDKLNRKDGPDDDEFAFVVDASKSPRAIDLTPTSEERKDKKQQGIYELDGDKLKLCLADPGKRRPTKFASGPGSDDEFMVLERKK